MMQIKGRVRGARDGVRVRDVQKNPAGRLRGSGGPAGASREVSVQRDAMVHGPGPRRIPKMEEDVTAPHGSKANTFFQSSFMEMTNQPRALASS